MMVSFPEYPFLCSHFLKCITIYSKPETLLRPQTEETAGTQAVQKKFGNVILQFFVEIYEYVATNDHIHLAKNSVGHQIVVGKDDLILERLIDDHRTVLGSIVISKGAPTAGLLIVA